MEVEGFTGIVKRSLIAILQKREDNDKAEKHKGIWLLNTA